MYTDLHMRRAVPSAPYRARATFHFRSVEHLALGRVDRVVEMRCCALGVVPKEVICVGEDHDGHGLVRRCGWPSAYACLPRHGGRGHRCTLQYHVSSDLSGKMLSRPSKERLPCTCTLKITSRTDGDLSELS